jgi:16S rRNA (guanine527-N7)-methyltransferase
MKNEIKRIFYRSGIALTDRQLDRFHAFHGMLVKYNDEFDLTRLIKFEDIVIKHFIDSVYPGIITKLPVSLLDIGTGPGFPGIPLKIMNPGLKLTLAEPKHKRVKFLHMAAEELELDFEIYPHLVTEKSFFNVEGVITRALETAAGTLQRTCHFLPEGGQIILMKGPDADTDLKTSARPGYELKDDIAYTLPGTSYHRRLLIFQKTEKFFRKSYLIMKNIDETPGTVIASADNKRFKDFKRLLTADGIKKEGRAIISGRKIIKDIMEGGWQPSAIILPDSYTESDPLLAELFDRISPEGGLYILKKGLYGELDTFNTNGPLAVLPVPDMPEFSGQPEGCVLLLPFQDPANTGAVVRSAAAFGVKNAVCLKGSAHPFHPKSVRSSAGAVFSMNFTSGPAIDELTEEKFRGRIVPLDKGGVQLHEFKFPENFFLLPGVEGPGLPEGVRGERVSIPIEAAVESLSAPIAVSIFLYEWKRGRV